jgi:hypothetical protein
MDQRVDEVIAELIEAVDGVDPIADAELIVALAALADRVDATLTTALTRFVAEGRHELDGWRSAASWLRAHTPLTDRRAIALATTVKRLQAWPEVADAYDHGALNGAQVETLVRGVGKDHVELFAEHAAEITPMLVGLTVADTRTAIGEWDRLADAVCSPDPLDMSDGPTAPDSDGDGVHPDGLDGADLDARVHLSRTFRDRGVLDADLDPDTTALVDKALALLEPPDPPGGPARTAAQRRAIALRRMARFVLDHHPSKGRRPGRQHPHVSVIIDLGDLYAASLRGHGIRTADDLDQFLEQRSVSIIEEGFLRHALAHRPGSPHTYDGHHLTPAALATLFGPGTLLSRLVMAEGRVLDQGTDVRFARGSLRDAMLTRDIRCRFPGCDAPTAWTDGHHITRFGPDGPTALTNLVALCASHHGTVHRNGWTTTIHDDTTITFHRPDGTTITSPPPRATRPPALPLHLPGRAPDAAEGADILMQVDRSIEPVSPTHDDHAPDLDRHRTAAVELRDLVITAVDPDGHPLTAVHGDSEVHLRWDHTPPDQRADELARIRERIRDLRPIPPTDPLAA